MVKKKITVPTFSKLCCLGCHGDFHPHQLFEKHDPGMKHEVQTLHAVSVQELLHMLENVLMFNGTKQTFAVNICFLISAQ